LNHKFLIFHSTFTVCLVAKRVKRERGEKELEKREVDKKYSRFKILFGIREKEEK